MIYSAFTLQVLFQVYHDLSTRNCKSLLVDLDSVAAFLNSSETYHCCWTVVQMGFVCQLFQNDAISGSLSRYPNCQCSEDSTSYIEVR